MAIFITSSSSDRYLTPAGDTALPSEMLTDLPRSMPSNQTSDYTYVRTGFPRTQSSYPVFSHIHKSLVLASLARSNISGAKSSRARIGMWPEPMKCISYVM